MIPPIESIQYLIDVFIEGGYAEEEDLDHLDAIHYWLRDEEIARDAAFRRRITKEVIKESNPLLTQEFPPIQGWVTETRHYDSPAEMPVNRAVEDGPLDPENPPENRSSYTIVDTEGNEYIFTKEG